MTETPLLDWSTQRAAPAPEPPTIQERFEEFDAKHPEVYQRLVAMAWDLKRKGRTRVGMKMLFEVIRWETLLGDEQHADGFKLNNVFTSRYARKIMDDYPELKGVFEVRELKSA